MPRILGIDPGSISTGYGIIESEGQKLSYVACGNIRTGGGSFPERLEEIYFAVAGIVEQYSPDEVAVERAFVHKNADSALKLGQARAAAICGTLVRRVPLHEYTPRAVKLAVVGKGGAGKEQVQHMMRVLLGLKGELQADSADALAIAICHAHSRGLKAELAALVRAGSRR
ncbi:MAG TPA: crossover junction endodeoxyribonuclease RuvC [Gammaproteobacteria bacterium]|nr:crossover junction endodeoxyribonuclease RuvC [Gammaproteobacteria bacterium]